MVLEPMGPSRTCGVSASGALQAGDWQPPGTVLGAIGRLMCDTPGDGGGEDKAVNIGVFGGVRREARHRGVW